MAAENNLGGSAWWIIVITAAYLTTIFFMIWSFHANSVKGGILSIIIFATITAGLILSKGEIFNSGTWSENSLSFTLAFVFALLLKSGGPFSFFSIGESALFSQIVNELPPFLDFLFHIVLSAISEEILWIIGIPFALFSAMNALSGSVSILSNKVLQFAIVAIVTMATFATFHVGKLVLAFLLAAMVFRLLIVILVIGDQEFNIFPGIKLVPAFAIGLHLGYNWGDFGFMKGLDLLIQNLGIGSIVIILISAFLISGLNQIVIMINGLYKKVVL